MPGGHAGCILAAATYQDRLFDGEVKAANRRAHLAWRERFRGHFERIALAYPPREPVDAGDMADMVSAVIEGGMILARGMGDPQVLVRQVLQARQMVKAVYARG